jgi:genome maintenance exonuclease 1
MITTNRHKGFLHNPVYLPDLETEYVDGKRYYKTPAGNLPSVTTVLGQKLKNPGLEAWKARVGEEEAKRVSTQAAGRGSAVHLLCEKYLSNDPDYKRGAMPFNLVTFSSIKKHLDLCIGTVYGLEVPLWSKRLGTAGRTDLLAGWLGVNSVIDFKTSKRKKEEEDIQSYFLQATVYSMMAEELTEHKFPQIVVIIAVDHDDAQIFVKNRDQYVDKVLEVFTG